jgi:hypothetical protein
MSSLKIAQPAGIAPVDATRTFFERVRDALDPLWRRARWSIARGRGGIVRRDTYATGVVRLSSRERAIAREILARRLSR